MRYIGRLLGYLLMAVNALFALLLFVCAYSSYLDPQSHPIVSSTGIFFPILLFVNLLFLLFWLVVYWRYALFPLLVFLISWNSVQTYFPINLLNDEAPENSIKLLSYNTRAFGQHEPHTKEKPNGVLEYLQNSDADIICLQEYIWGGKLKKKDIDYALRNYKYRHYHPLSDGLNGLGCYSRYPILSVKPIKYESGRNGSVAYYIKVEKDTLLVINNHLESNKIIDSDVETYQEMVDSPDKQKVMSGTKKLLKKFAEAGAIRAKQADVLVEKIKNEKVKNILVCGDFNDTPISYTHRVLDDELKDAFVESGNGLGISYNQHQLYFRIDHILLSNHLRVYECEVDKSVDSSDHYPVWCRFSLQ